MGERDLDAISAVLALVGIWEGVLPFAAKAFGWEPFLSIPWRLDAPAWWLVSTAVAVVCLAGMWAVERRKARL